jgi:hypothetical protein
MDLTFFAAAFFQKQENQHLTIKPPRSLFESAALKHVK